MDKYHLFFRIWRQCVLLIYAFIVVQLSIVEIAAQTRQPASLTVQPGVTPEPLSVLDNTGMWVPIGAILNHQFAPYNVSYIYPTHAALLAGINSSAFVSIAIEQQGFTSIGDGGAAKYDWNGSSTCTDDRVTCLSLGGNTGRYIMRPTLNVSPQAMGCVGNDQVDDTACLQLGLNYVPTIGTRYVFDSIHKYHTTATLVASQPIDIEGPFRYGIWTINAQADNNRYACPWGIETTSNLDVLDITAITAVVHNLCIQAAPSAQNPVPATGGAGIAVFPPSLTTYQTGVHLEGNTILQAYDGITVNGAGQSPNCCGEGTTADGVSVNRNTIINPGDWAIVVGKNTHYAATVGLTMVDNAILCNSPVRGNGIVLYDGAIWYDGTQNGPEGCTIGVAVIPGATGITGQNAQFDGKGVMGDQSVLHDLMIAPYTGSVVGFSEFDNIWAGGTSNSPNDQEVLITDANGGQIYNTTFMGGTIHSGNTQSTLPVVDIENSHGDIINTIFNGVSIDCWQNPNGCGTGMRVIGGLPGGLMYFSLIGDRFGAEGSYGFNNDLYIDTNPGGAFITVNSSTFQALTPSSNGVAIAIITPSSGNGSAIGITGNNMFAANTPISYTPNTNDIVTISNNMGVDNQCPDISASGNSITFPSNFNNCWVLNTPGTPNITNIGPVYQNREITLQSDQTNGFTMSYDGTQPFPICNSITIKESQLVTLLWRAKGTCWTTSL